MEAKKIILQFICPDKAGVLSAATQFLFKRNAFMTEVSSFSDNDTKILMIWKKNFLQN